MNALTQNYDICVMGSQGSGKSTLVQYFLHGEFLETEAMIEDMYVKVVRNGTSYNEYTIFDTTAHYDLHSSSRHHQVQNMATLLLVYEVSSYASFEEIEDVWERIQLLRGEDNLPPVVLVGTKCDLDREVSFEQGQHLADMINALGFCETSSRLGLGISDAFAPLIQYLLVNKKSNKSSISRFSGYESTLGQEPVKAALKEVLDEGDNSSTHQNESVSDSPLVDPLPKASLSSAHTRRVSEKVSERERDRCCVIV